MFTAKKENENASLPSPVVQLREASVKAWDMSNQTAAVFFGGGFPPASKT
jgi:hypothetical protein